MKAIEARVGGIERYFAFVYPFYEENESNFGMLDRRGTPLRSLAAYSRAAAVLGHKRYLGDLRCDLPAVKRTRSVRRPARNRSRALYRRRDGLG